jgi:hypothetical protein
MQKTLDWTVVGYNVSVDMVTVISRSPTQVDAEESARNAPSRFFKHITILKPSGDAYKLCKSITNL